jgi:hypothetical protein
MALVPGLSKTSLDAEVGARHALCELRLHPGRVVAPAGEPVSVGVPFPPGVLHDASSLRIGNAGDQPARIDTEVLERWPDGSVRWAFCSFRATCKVAEELVLFSITGADEEAHTRFQPLITERSNRSIRVDTGRAIVEIGERDGFHLSVTDRDASSPWATMRLQIVDAREVPLRNRVNSVEIERNGVSQCVVVVSGRLLDAAGVIFVARIQAFRDLAVLRVELTVRNSKPAEHAEGFWDLGDPGSVLLRGISLVTTFDQAVDDLRCSASTDEPLRRWEKPFEIYQESSGGANWKSAVHRNRDGVVPLEINGYEIRDAHRVAHGERATPVVNITAGQRECSVTVPYFWQAFPKSISVDDACLTVGVLPARFPDLHELQGGEQTTGIAWFAFGTDAITEIPLDWCRTSTLVAVSPDRFAAAEAVPYIAPASHDADARYHRFVSAAIDGPASFRQRRERVDEYGWRNFGDLYADHEAVHASGDQPFVSHYNNQYDAVAGFILQYMRTGDPRWWTMADELARHVIDVDTYHTADDKSAYSGGLFWHTNHYVDAGTSTHRCYSRRTSRSGGGPSAEHNYTTGLMLHYFMTGRVASKHTVLELAEWVLRMDDGRLTPFRWFANAATGLASSTADPLYHGPGRGAGNSINALLDAHRLTLDGRYLDKAEQLIRRAIHPDDNIEARNLLDAEQRWSYTVFLQVLGKYLDYKAVLNASGDAHEYAQASLLRYARWMADHEQPYLLTPEKLEYPTETWAAQDMRKAEVFRFAARHSAGSERTRFLERSQFFFDYVVTTLEALPTGRLTRPIVILLTNGYAHGRIRGLLDVKASSDQLRAFPMRRNFVPQKSIAKRRAAIVGAIAFVFVASGILSLLL